MVYFNRNYMPKAFSVPFWRALRSADARVRTQVQLSDEEDAVHAAMAAAATAAAQPGHTSAASTRHTENMRSIRSTPELWPALRVLQRAQCKYIALHHTVSHPLFNDATLP